MMDKNSKSYKVLRHLHRHGAITTFYVLNPENGMQTTRLAAIIHDLKRRGFIKVTETGYTNPQRTNYQYKATVYERPWRALQLELAK